MSYTRFLDKNVTLSYWLTPVFIALIACGGGSSEKTPEVDKSGGTSPSGNSAPTVTISSPEDATVGIDGRVTTLTATASDPEDGNLSANIQWTSNLDGILGTGATLNVSLSGGEHLISANITDSADASASSQISYRVNLAPTVNAGDDKAVVENNQITIQASASDDDGEIVSYEWQQTSGQTITLNNSSASNISFNAPAVTEGNSQTYTFQVTVSDNDGTTAQDLISVIVLSATSQADCTLTISPGDSFNSAFNQLSAGDTLCLNDGRYQQAMDIPSYINVRAINDGQAEIDGGSTLGEEWSGALVQLHGSYSSVRGLRVHHAGEFSDACSVAGTNNTFKVMSCSHGGSHKHKIPMKIAGSGHLIEDSWFFGEGRYVVQCFGGADSTLRRNVARWDSTIANEPDEPNAAFSIYACKNMTIENNISIDYGTPQTAMRYGGDFYEPAHNIAGYTPDNNYWLGNFAINHSPDTDNNRAMRFDPDMETNGNVVKDFYVRDVGVGFVISPKMINLVIDKCSMINTTVGNVTTGSKTAVDCHGEVESWTRYVDRDKTNEALFPWPNEALIKAHMCASGERQSAWCSSNLSLTDYVLNQ